MPVSENHRILSDLGALFCRANWQCWFIAIEPKGLTDRNYDVLAVKSSPRSIVGIEVKVSRQDFLAGIKKGHFEKTNYISELWLAYTGDFQIKELPKHVGILKLNKVPKCKVHFDAKAVCPPSCKDKKNLCFTVVKEAEQFHGPQDRHTYFNAYAPKWIQKIAISNTTKLVHNIEYNLFGEVIMEPSENNEEENGEDV